VAFRTSLRFHFIGLVKFFSYIFSQFIQSTIRLTLIPVSSVLMGSHLTKRERERERMFINSFSLVSFNDATIIAVFNKSFLHSSLSLSLLLPPPSTKMLSSQQSSLIEQDACNILLMGSKTQGHNQVVVPRYPERFKETTILIKFALLSQHNG